MPDVLDQFYARLKVLEEAQFLVYFHQFRPFKTTDGAIWVCQNTVGWIKVGMIQSPDGNPAVKRIPGSLDLTEGVVLWGDENRSVFDCWLTLKEWEVANNAVTQARREI